CFRAQAVGPAREANMYRARRQTMRGAKTALGCRPRFGQRIVEARAMSMTRKFWIGLLASCVSVTAASEPAAAEEQPQTPTILFVVGDDMGGTQPSFYHRGVRVGEPPNMDRMANEGAIFMVFPPIQSCPPGRNAFFTGMQPLRTGMIPPQLPGSPSYLQPGTP